MVKKQRIQKSKKNEESYHRFIKKITASTILSPESISDIIFIIEISFLFVLSYFLRLRYINAGLFEADSVGLAMSLEDTVKTGTLYGMFNGRYGQVIINLITYIPYHFITGINSAERTILYTEILFASFSVIILFLFIDKIFNNRTIAFLASILFSISPIFLSVTTYGDSIGIETFFILTSFYLLASFHEDNKDNSQLYLVLSSITMAFSIMVRESSMIFIPLYFIFYLNPVIKLSLIKLGRNFISLDPNVLKFKNLISIFIPFLLVFGTYTYYFFHNILYRTLFVSDDGSGTIAKFMGIFSPILSTSSDDMYFNLSIIGIGLAIVGLITFFKYKGFKNQKNKTFYFIFFLLWAGTFFYFGNTSVYSPYYLVIVSVPIFIFIAVGMNYLYKLNRFFGIISLVILIYILFSQIQPIIEYRHQFSGEKEYALWLKNKIPNNSWVIAMNDAVFLNYYANIKTINHPIGAEKMKTWIKDINSILKNGTNIYIIDSGFAYDPGNIFLNSMYQNFDMVNVDKHMIEDYHKATILDNRYEEVLTKVNKIMTPEELLSDNIIYDTNITNREGKFFLNIISKNQHLNDAKVKIESIVKGDYFSHEYRIGDINQREIKEIEISQNYKNPLKIMIWNPYLKSWMLLFRGYLTCGDNGCESHAIWFN